MDQGRVKADSESSGEEFDPAADILMNVFDTDDNRVLAEQDLEELELPDDELPILEQEKDVPLEALISIYSYKEDGTLGAVPVAEGADTVNMEAGDQDGKQFEGDHEHRRPSPSSESLSSVSIGVEQACEYFEDQPQSLPGAPLVGEGRQLRSGSRQSSQPGKSEIKIGPEHQAEIPEVIPKEVQSAFRSEIDDDTLMWAPAETQDDDLNKFIARLKEGTEPPEEPNNKVSFPKRSQWDDEEALKLLLQCGYNYEKAIMVGASIEVVTNNQWSQEECKNFEKGIRTYGKDFNLIQQNQVPTRSVGEIVGFYYFWKKSDRHDKYVNQFKFDLDASDLMDEFLDELQMNSEQSSGESSQDSDTSGNKNQGNDSDDDNHIASSDSELGSSSLQDMGDLDPVASQQFEVDMDSGDQADTEMDD